MYKYQQTHLHQDQAIVTSVDQAMGELIVTLNETIFYPGGGGQPHDHGHIENDHFKGKIKRVSKDNGVITHCIEPIKGELKQDDKVTMYVDGDRKIKISKMHTGEHILYKSLEKFIPDIEMVKVDLDEHESSIFIKCNELNWDVLFKSENLANQIIDEEREILTHIISKDELDEWTDKLRIKLERIKDDKIRIIEVKDFDYSACFGTHVNKSNEISNVFITKFNQVKGKWEIRFVVDTKEKLYDYASVSRISAELLETDMTSVNDEIKRLQNQIEDYKIRYREISKKLLDFNKHEKINDINLIYNIVEDIPKKQLIDKSSELLNDKTIVLFINLNEDRATVLLNISSDLKINAPKLLNKLLLKFDGKGGGRDNFAMGSISNQDLAKVIDEFKKLI